MKQYQPLYLKYRPQSLSELIGQEVVSKTLTNAINYNKIVHAYLFCGPRGTGKTSTARILAKSLNCEKGITIDPCGKCVSCQSITRGNSLDVIEIDAASHRKVEDAEDLINRVSLGTYGSRFKIYIIDEVHMLTDHAFNALLKTLEEPPKNVIFILATTEEYKVIPTIISRCQKLDFKPVLQDDLEKRIKYIATQEKINIDETVIRFISKRSRGCLRDAVSLLDQISVLQEENKVIEPKEVFELFGTVDRGVLLKLAEAVLTFNRQESINIAEDLVKSGKDIVELYKNFLEMIIDLAKARIDSNYKKELSRELNNNLDILNNIKHSHLLKIIDKLQDSQTKLRFALSQELQFMFEVMSMIDEDFLVSFTDLKERIEKLEGRNDKEVKNVIASEAKQSRSNLPESEQDSFVADVQSLLPSPSVKLEPVKKESTDSTDLDLLWKNIVGLIESNPTKTLLMQSGSYLISLNEDVMEVGVSKDMFLPRLEHDTKKKEMILKSTKLASGKEPAAVKYKFLPRKSEENNTENLQTQISEPGEEALSTEAKISYSSKIEQTSFQSDDLTGVIKNLMGAKEID